MNHAHSLVAAIEDGSIETFYPTKDEVPEALKATRSRILRSLAKGVRKAQKFDFSAVADTFDAPLLLSGLDLLREDLFDLPFPFTFFEFGRTEGTLYTALAVHDPQTPLFRVVPFFHEGLGWIDAPYLVTISSESARADQMRVDPGQGNSFPIPEWLKEPVACTAQLVIRAIACLEAEGVRVETQAAPERLNKKRERSGKVPLFEHKIVKIDRCNCAGSLGSDHSEREAPRLHWRRGHLRRLAQGQAVRVRPCLVGDRTRGFVSHDYAAV